MADTIRTLSDILANLFQDGQPAGSISPQDMRDLIISAFGDYSKTGGVAGWRDLTSSVNTGKITGSTAPTWEEIEGGIYGYSFAPGARNEIMLDPYHVDHDYKDGTPIHIHAHWETTSTDTGVARIGLTWRKAKGHQQEAFTTPATLYLEQAGYGVNKYHMITEDLTGILGGGLIEPDTLIDVLLFRDGAHVNDTYADKIFIKKVDFHYQTDHHSTKNRTPDFYT